MPYQLSIQTQKGDANTNMAILRISKHSQAHVLGALTAFFAGEESAKQLCNAILPHCPESDSVMRETIEKTDWRSDLGHMVTILPESGGYRFLKNDHTVAILQ